MSSTTACPHRPSGKALPALVEASCLALAGCFDNRIAGGTGTVTGNTVSARVVLPDGAPAAGARVTLFPLEYVPDAVPGAARSEPPPMTAVTDSSGRFTLEAEAGSAYLLEGNGTLASDSLVVWKKDLYLREDEAATDLGTLSLNRSGSLSGTVIQPDRASAKAVWAGFPGTERFTPADEAGNFILEGIPPGAHELLVIRDLGPGKGLERIKLWGWHLAPGAHGNMDTVTLGAPVSGETRVETRACTEEPASGNPAIIAEYPYEGPAVAEHGERLRTILESDPPQWLEIDLCLATWRSKGVLPSEAASYTGSMSSREADFLTLDSTGLTMRIDSNGRVSQLLQFPPSLVTAQFYREKVYALFKGDSIMKVYADEAAFLADRPESGLELPFATASIRDLAIADSIAYFVEAGGNPKFHAMDLRSGTYRGAFNLAGFEGSWYNVISAPEGRLWILNDSGLIQLGDPVSRTILRKLKVAVSGKRLRALARYNPVDSE